MGRLKPSKRAAWRALRETPLGADVVAVLRQRGLDPTIRPTPAHLVPMSDIVSTLVEPLRAQLDEPDDQVALAALSNLAATAWNLSRLARGPDFTGDAMETLAGLLHAKPSALRIAESLFEHARDLYPEDTRMIVSTDVEVDRKGVHFKAAYLARKG